MRKRHGRYPFLVPAIAMGVTLMLAGCSPDDYADSSANRGATVETAPGSEGVTGGSDPTAVSGRIQQDTSETIHHPAADGNSGRPPERRGTVTEAGAPPEGRASR